MKFHAFNRHPFVSGCAAWFVALSSHAADLPPAALQALRQAGVPPSALSVQIAPVGTSGAATAPRLTHRADEPRNPASVMKLITTYAGLSLLGPDFTWRNRIYADGPIKDGVLQGNLIVRGSGDPKLVVELFSESSGGPNMLKVRGGMLTQALAHQPSEQVTVQLSVMRKDVRSMLEQIQSMGRSAPLTEHTLQQFERAAALRKLPRQSFVTGWKR